MMFVIVPCSIRSLSMKAALPRNMLLSKEHICIACLHLRAELCILSSSHQWQQCVRSGPAIWLCLKSLCHKNGHLASHSPVTVSCRACLRSFARRFGSRLCGYPRHSSILQPSCSNINNWPASLRISEMALRGGVLVHILRTCQGGPWPSRPQL